MKGPKTTSINLCGKMNFSDLSIVNPKRKKQPRSAWDEFFPYYAGYPDSFARNILTSAKLDQNAIVLDPWNGSGTTTYVASQMGYAAVGLDLNPVMIIVARSRMLPASEADSLTPLSYEIIRRARAHPVECPEDDPLNLWFETKTANWIRSIEISIRSALVGDLTLTPNGVNFDRISSIASSFYVALFNLSKYLASEFQSSNPTWIRKPKKSETRSSLPLDEISDNFLKRVNLMSDALGAKADLLFVEPTPVSIRLSDSTVPYTFDKKVDFVLTSPPYCTRIDYTAATRIQLAVLHPLLSLPINELSRSMIGSIKVPKVSVNINEKWGAKCVQFLRQVSEHPSHASAGYYLKSHIDYFDKMDRSLSNISSSLKSGGAAVLVVQDSHYKDVHNDVPSIIGEIADSHNMTLRRRDDFQVKSSMSGINPRARVYSKHFGIVESVLCFEKI